MNCNLLEFIEKFGGIPNALFEVYGAKKNQFPENMNLFNEQVAAALKSIPGIDIYGEWAVSSLIWLNMYGWKKAIPQDDAINDARINPIYIDVTHFLIIPQAFNHLAHVIDALNAKILSGNVSTVLIEKLKLISMLAQIRVVIIRDGVIIRINAHNALVEAGKPGLIDDHVVKGKVILQLSTMKIDLPSGLSKKDTDLLGSLPTLLIQCEQHKIDPYIHLQPSLINAEVNGCTSSFCCTKFIECGKKPNTVSTVDKLNVFVTKDGKIYILVIMRKNAQGIWCWALPGGFVDQQDTINAIAALKAKAIDLTPESLADITTTIAAEREFKEEVGHKECNFPIDPRVFKDPENFFQLGKHVFEMVDQISITQPRPHWEARLMFIFGEMTVGVNISIFNEIV